MKKNTFYFIFLLYLNVFSQSKTFTLDWSDYKVFQISDKTYRVPSFQDENFSFDTEKGLTFYVQWKDASLINEKTYSISNTNYQVISERELYDLNKNTIPKNLEYSLNNVFARNSRAINLAISPIINDNGVYKKLTSFSLRYSFSNASGSTFRSTNAISNSVLRNGNWYKFYVEESGVYKLSREFLQSLGVSINNIDPRTIKIFGSGGQMIPLANSEPYPIDPEENAITVVGEEDGVFNTSDYILFYAVGPKEFNNESNTNINIYTDKAYYYLNISSGNGKRITDFNQPTGAPSLILDTFSDYQFHEEDEVNLAKIGRRWFGNSFGIDNEQSFEFSFPNIVISQPIRLKVFAAAIGESTTNMQVNVNGTEVDNFSFFPITETILANEDFFNGQTSVNSETITIDLNYNNNGNPSAIAYLDYISVEAIRDLTYVNESLRFKNYQTAQNTGIAQYNISNASSVNQVWNITNPTNITKAENTTSEAIFSFKRDMGSLEEFITIDGNFLTPLIDANRIVENQDIKGTIFLNDQGVFQDIDYIIVTPQQFLTQANRLAQINRAENNLNVKVLTLDQIYAEFSTGNQDIGAIRNLVKYVYDNASVDQNKLKYLCLFGDASYDYKNRISNNTNFVPLWHAYSSFNLTNSFISDDFYGMMDENEGTMTSSNRLDIAVGRILADSPQRAKELVDKIQQYYEADAYGPWRNNVLVVSDDVDEEWEKILQNTTNSIGDEISAEKPFINVTKIHTDSYLQESSPGGDRYPSVTSAISDAIELGALVVNYFGHGGEDGLAVERIFEQDNAQNLRNICKFNCFVTVTCEYTKFDDPNRITAGELTYWNKQGGAIGLITTTRQIFVTTGVQMNTVLDQFLFGYGTNNYPTMAESLRLAKNNITNPQRRLVFFIGDPAMKLAFPQPNVRLTQINDIPIDQNPQPLKALGYAKISGEVTDVNGNVLTNYNGNLNASVFDKKIDRQTLGNDGIRENGELIILDYQTLGEVIFRGQATVTNGTFEFDFIVPRDIGVNEGNGRVSFYASTENPLSDQSGASENIIIGGINEDATEDNIGPTIALFMNDENFVSGGITNESPTLIAKLEDEHGINTASGIGHDIVAIIDGDETNPFVLNDYYESEVDDFQKGQVTYPFRDLEPGLHTLTLKAWDVYNNSSISEMQFVVFDKDKDLVINNVLNYPNPFINYTEFWFNHNSSEPLDVSVQIFTVSGKLVRTINGQTKGDVKTNSSLSRDLVWDGRDDFGDKIGKGVYVYKLTVKSNSLNKKVEKYEKLVIL